jgi:hypothetical protein
MRLPASILSLLFTTILLGASIAASHAQDGSGGDAQQDARQRYDNISFAGRTEFEISDPAGNSRSLPNS